jgi:hypothetical protein
MTTRPFAPSLALLALVGTLAGCVVHEGEADVTFLWDFASGTTCQAEGVGFIDVYVESYDDGSWFEDRGIPCTAGGITYENLEPGRYFVEFAADGGWGAQQNVRFLTGDNEFAVHLTQSR